MPTHEEMRTKLGIPRGQMLSMREMLPLAVRARAAVIAVRARIRHAGVEEDSQIQLLWETLAANLYLLEESVSQCVLPVLESKGLFGVVGAGTVAPVPMDGPDRIPIRFLGRGLNLREVLKLDVRFDPKHEEGAKIVLAQARVLLSMLPAAAARTGGRKGAEAVAPSSLGWLALAAGALLFWRR